MEKLKKIIGLLLLIFVISGCRPPKKIYVPPPDVVTDKSGIVKDAQSDGRMDIRDAVEHEDLKDVDHEQDIIHDSEEVSDVKGDVDVDIIDATDSSEVDGVVVIECTHDDDCKILGSQAGECTVPVCTSKGLCALKPANEGMACAPRNKCVYNAVCHNGECVGRAVDCNDDNICTYDYCDPSKGCIHKPVSKKCDDGNKCTQKDICVDGVCKGMINTCECTKNSDCKAFEDGNLCNGTLVCQDNKCVVDPKTVVKCPGVDAQCQKNVCNPKTGKCELKNLPDGTLCDDHNICTPQDRCEQGKCRGEGYIVCDDNDPCTLDSCDPQKGCQHKIDSSLFGTLCDDKDDCTAHDVCTKHGCRGTPIIGCGCDGHEGFCEGLFKRMKVDLCHVKPVCDNNMCVTEAIEPPQCKVSQGHDPQCWVSECDPRTGECKEHSKRDGTVCDDGNWCTVQDQCINGVCQGKKRDCRDDNPCTKDFCDKDKNKCVHEKQPDHTSCGDLKECIDGECRAFSCPGGAGCSCKQDSDCDSGVCIMGENGMICAKICNDGKCPPGFECVRPVGTNVQDKICVYRHANLCRPCKGQSDCDVRFLDPEKFSNCVPFDAEHGFYAEHGMVGAFCLSSCSKDGSCPEGYKCGDDDWCYPVDSDGKVTNECPCPEKFHKPEYKTRCTVKNEYGECDGERTCYEKCNAPTPQLGTDGTVECNEYSQDSDGDGINDNEDNCPEIPNPEQSDIDEDGYGDVCDDDMDGDGDPNLTDCKQKDPKVHHGAIEKCNSVDDDCDGETDEEGAEGCTDFYIDKDGDDYGVEGNYKCLCNKGDIEDYTAVQAGDCNDGDKDMNPGLKEVCGDEKDNDCDGFTDEEGAQGCNTYYLDEDGDDYGVEGEGKCLCKQDEENHYTATKVGDCNDYDINMYPGAKENCNGQDDDCDGETDEGLDSVPCERTNDFGTCKGTAKCFNGIIKDCNAPEPKQETCNESDDDCDGQTDEEGAEGCKRYFLDRDGDGYGVEGDYKCLCKKDPDTKYTAAQAGDCNDGNKNMNPNMTEKCNGIDDDCDGFTDEGTDENNNGIADECEELCEEDPPNPCTMDKVGDDGQCTHKKLCDPLETIDSNLTKDKSVCSVYEDGFCGHRCMTDQPCVWAYAGIKANTNTLECMTKSIPDGWMCKDQDGHLGICNGGACNKCASDDTCVNITSDSNGGCNVEILNNGSVCGDNSQGRCYAGLCMKPTINFWMGELFTDKSNFAPVGISARPDGIDLVTEWVDVDNYRSEIRICDIVPFGNTFERPCSNWDQNHNYHREFNSNADIIPFSVDRGFIIIDPANVFGKRMDNNWEYNPVSSPDSISFDGVLRDLDIGDTFYWIFGVDSGIRPAICQVFSDGNWNSYNNNGTNVNCVPIQYDSGNLGNINSGISTKDYAFIYSSNIGGNDSNFILYIDNDFMTHHKLDQRAQVIIEDDIRFFDKTWFTPYFYSIPSAFVIAQKDINSFYLNIYDYNNGISKVPYKIPNNILSSNVMDICAGVRQITGTNKIVMHLLEVVSDSGGQKLTYQVVQFEKTHGQLPNFMNVFTVDKVNDQLFEHVNIQDCYFDRIAKTFMATGTVFEDNSPKSFFFQHSSYGHKPPPPGP